MSPITTRSTPARLTTQATVAIPRHYLVLLALVYILAGLFFRDPWKTDDVVGIATMLTTAQQAGQTWLLPQLGHLAYAQAGPLSTWVGALSILVFAPVFELFMAPTDALILAARLPNLLWFGIIAWAIWATAYQLGQRPEAQPLALPFGGEPGPRDYGHMIADATLLLTLATAGIMWRLHETSEVPVLIAAQAVTLLALARLPSRPAAASLLLGVGLAAAFLARGLIGGLPVLGAAVCCLLPGLPLWAQRRWGWAGILLGLVLCLLWWIPANQSATYWMQHWWHWNLGSFQLPSHDALMSLLRDLPWFLWPTWPFALMALWRWRTWLLAPHIWVPGMFMLWALLIALCLADPFEPEFSLLALPCAVLAGFALPTLRRGVINSLDWFAVMCFSLACATVWLGWIALQTGWPAQISRNIARQTQGFEPSISWGATAIALAGTLGWLALVRWRLHAKPSALWRGTVLSAGGITLTWLLLVSLWMPALDYARSYRPVSQQLAAALQHHQAPGECVRGLSLGTGQRASFLVFTQLDFTFDARCALVLQQTSQAAIQDGSAAFSNHYAQVLWVGKRGADHRGEELFRLLRIRTP